MKNTAKTWREFIQGHEDQEEYDRNAGSIQKIIDYKEQPATNFAYLIDHPTLVTMTKSSIEDEVQATFFHSKVKSSLLSSEHDQLALTGFGKRACAMKVDAKEIFKTSSTKKKIPSFKALMNCSDTDELLALKSKDGWEEGKLESHAILPPFLTNIFFSEDSVKAQDVLIRMIRGIKMMRSQEEREEDDQGKSTVSSWEELNEEDTEIESIPPARTRAQAAKNKESEAKENQSKNPGTKEMGKKNTTIIGESPDEKSFSRVLIFLWGMIHEANVVKTTHLNLCTKKSTEKWLDELHDKHLEKAQLHHRLHHPSTSNQDDSNLNNAAVAIHKLSDIWGRKIVLEEQEREDREQKLKDKGFEKLSEVQQTVLILITATDKDSDDDVELMRPTEDMMKILTQKVGFKAQAHLQYEFNKHNHLCDVGLAMATQMKNGIIMSSPSTNNINGMSPLFLPDQASEERLSGEVALRLEEQMSMNKITESDLRLITKCKIHFPKNFGEYVHMIRNFHRLTIIVAGEESIFALKIKSLHDHAITHERCYREIDRDYFHLYAFILDLVHKRSQHFIHSATLGLVSKLKVSKLEFSDLFSKIEDGDLEPTKPKWLKTEKKRDYSSASSVETDINPKKKAKEVREKPQSIKNPDFENELKCPEDVKYASVFHHANRRGVEEVKHEDGSTRCNNWFFRGWCTENCPMKESHEKKLLPAEKQKCKEYLKKLIGKHKKWAAGYKKNKGTDEG